MKSYEYKDKSGRVLCKAHHLLRCYDCEKMYELELENETLASALNDARKEIHMLKNIIRRKNQILKYYADDTIYDAQYKLDIMRDLGDRAKRELARG